MKRLILLLALGMLILSGCVSNKAFKAEKDKVNVIESRQNKQETELEVLRKDILAEKEKVETLILTLNQASSKIAMIEPMQTELDANTEDVAWLQDEIATLKNSSADLLNNQNALQAKLNDQTAATDKDMKKLQKEIKDLLDDSDFVMEAITDKLQELSAQSKGFASKEELNTMMTSLEDAIQELGDGSQSSGLARQSDLNELQDMVMDMYAEFISAGMVGNEEMEARMGAEASKRGELMTNLLSRLQDVENELKDSINQETGVRDESMNSISQRLDAIELELGSLREDQINRQSSVSKDVSTLRSRVESLTETVNYELQDVIAAEKAKKEKQRQMSINAQYKIALDLYNQNKNEQSILKFEDFLEQFPNEALSPNAYYWIGENYYSGKKWSTALEYFDRVIKDYPEHHKAVDASLKAGMCHYNMGQKAEANNVFQQLKANHPKYVRIDLVNKYLRLIAQ